MAYVLYYLCSLLDRQSVMRLQYDYATAHYTRWQTSVVCIHLIHDIPHDKIPIVSPSRNVLYTCVGH